MYHIYFRAYSRKGVFLGSGRYGSYRSITAAAREASNRFSGRDEVRICKKDPFASEESGRRVAII